MPRVVSGGTGVDLNAIDRPYRENAAAAGSDEAVELWLLQAALAAGEIDEPNFARWIRDTWPK